MPRRPDGDAPSATSAIDGGRRSASRSTSRVGGRSSATWFRVALGTPHLAVAGAVLAAIFIAVPLLASLVSERATVTWFVALAPAVPIAAAVIAYATAADPAGNTGAATPLHSFRLVVLRTAILLAAVLPVGLLASVLLPVPTSLVLGWFLPAVAVVRARARRRHPVRPECGSPDRSRSAGRPSCSAASPGCETCR